jgi:thymidylate synthase (FAD)
MTLSDAQTREITEARQAHASTLRPTVAALEEILFQPISLLDHGFIRVIDYMGDDNAVVQAARVSYGRGTKKVSEDRGLIRYLMRHWHTTPFEMAEIKLHVKLPIFVARQWIRHRTASVNEYSARYSLLDREFYLPDEAQLKAQAVTNRQGRGDHLEPQEARQVLDLLRGDAERTYANYAWMLNEDQDGAKADPNRDGLARELARINLTLGTYTQWYWKTNLHNLMNFLRLRADSHAQFEIRVYAEALLDVLARWVPLTHEAFLEHRLGAVTLSASAVQAVRRILAGESAEAASRGMPAREWREVAAALGLDNAGT